YQDSQVRRVVRRGKNGCEEGVNSARSTPVFHRERMALALEPNHNAAGDHDVVLMAFTGVHVQRKRSRPKISRCEAKRNLTEGANIESDASLQESTAFAGRPGIGSAVNQSFAEVKAAIATAEANPRLEVGIGKNSHASRRSHKVRGVTSWDGAISGAQIFVRIGHKGHFEVESNETGVDEVPGIIDFEAESISEMDRVIDEGHSSRPDSLVSYEG